MTSIPRLALAALLALPGAVAPADDLLPAPLAEKEVLAAVPVMEAELRDMRAAAGLVGGLERAVSSGVEDRRATVGTVRAGRVHLLAWSRERHPGLPLPEALRAAGLAEEQYRAVVHRLARVRQLAEDAQLLDMGGRDEADLRNVEPCARLRAKVEPQLDALARARRGGG